MSTAPPALPPRAGSLRGPRGLTWVTLRTHRGGLGFWFVLFAVVSVLFLWLYTLDVDTGYHGPCSTEPGGRFPLCGDALNPPDDTRLFDHVMEWLSGLLSHLPIVVAPFVGGALVARDMEQGTGVLAWTQSVTPTRWLAAKLGGAAVLLGGGTALLTVLHRWVWLTGEHHAADNWYFAENFRMSGPVTTGYVLLGLGVGAFVAVLTRRVLPTVGLAAGVMALVQWLADENRFSLWPADQVSGSQAMVLPQDTYTLEYGVVTASGERVPEAFCDVELADEVASCLDRFGGVDFYADVHPAAHFLPLQLVETGVALALAAALTAAAFRLLRRRMP